jgi:hypothetical protein
VHWVQPSFGYQAKCLGWIRDDYGNLNADHRKWMDALLAETGVSVMLEGVEVSETVSARL